MLDESRAVEQSLNISVGDTPEPNENQTTQEVTLQNEALIDAETGRYRLVEEHGERVLVSISSPNVFLRIEPGIAVNSSGLKRFGEQTIFLDGAFAGPPFHDNQKRQYSLDHHDGCVRPVTLSTCEQAAVVLITGLPINEGKWTLIINDPDLDAILAAWVLMNHIDLLRDDARLLAEAMPLLRVEGIIDSHGFGKGLLSALPADLLAAQKVRIEELMQPIQDLKQSGRWTAPEFEPLVLQELDAIDRMLLPAQLVEQLLEYQEYGRLRLHGRRIAILCCSKHGIYEVEEHLRRRYGKLLGLIILDQGDGKFTLRLSDSYLRVPLGRLYKDLNRLDELTSSAGGNDNLWGGSDDIGGSPRATGSALSGRSILEAVGRIYGIELSWGARIGAFFARLRGGTGKN